METLKISTRFSPNKAFLGRLSLLILLSVIWFCFLFIGNEEALTEAKASFSEGAIWYFAAIALVLGFATAAMVIEPKSNGRMQMEIVLAFLLVVVAGAVERFTLQSSGIFTASTTLIIYIFSRLIYVHWEENEISKKRRGGIEKRLANGPIMKVKKNEFPVEEKSG